MGRINSKKKGNTFELKIAKMLSKWSNEEFNRTPLSGGLHWNNDTRVISDIVPSQTLVNRGWDTSIEIKKVECNWDFSGFLENTAKTLNSHWIQCKDDAKREDLKPLLVFSKNYKGIYAMMYLERFLELNLQSLPHMELHLDNENLAIINFETLLENTTVEDFLTK